MIQPNFQKIKVNNSIAIGGMVALGKSTLTDALSEAIGANPIREIDSRDTLTTLLLESMYKRDGNNIYAPLFQIYFLLTRYNKYIEHSNDKQTAIFDRTIFED
ncbi:deoxynucleoside kinase [Clostridium sp.]|uniref:deoxynucleoside kinase n=1 Tax=Clostridium sp. TaxID=1506 RepID=UPI002638CD6A|nr:deoxynucleoside kinase [Clostridium sp.]